MTDKSPIHSRDGYVPLRGDTQACFESTGLRCEARFQGTTIWVPVWVAELITPLWDHESCRGRMIVARPTRQNTERLARFLRRCQRDFGVRDSALAAARRGDLIALFDRWEPA